MRAARVLALCCAALATPAGAEGERAGDFDHYVLALTWSPNWCARTGDAQGDDQCHPRHAHSFTLHGLWPQNEQGWPSFCRSAAQDPSRADTAAMTDIMGSGGLAWHQWKKHGRCSGLSSADYFALARRAYELVVIPAVFRTLNSRVTLPATVVQDAFVKANPGLSPDQITITCETGMIQGVRVCLTRNLQPRTCGPDVIRDCRLQDAVMDPVR